MLIVRMPVSGNVKLTLEQFFQSITVQGYVDPARCQLDPIWRDADGTPARAGALTLTIDETWVPMPGGSAGDFARDLGLARAAHELLKRLALEAGFCVDEEPDQVRPDPVARCEEMVAQCQAILTKCEHERRGAQRAADLARRPA